MRHRSGKHYDGQAQGSHLKLTDEEQLLIYRYHYADIPGTELAEIYGVSQQAISKRITKIRVKLKNLLEK